MAAARKSAMPDQQREETSRAQQGKKDKPRKQHKFFVVEVSEVGHRRYPRTLFGCETLEEALQLCKQMNSDAGFHKFAVRGDAPKTD